MSKPTSHKFGRNVLETLFESRARIKMLKFLFRNDIPGFTAKEVAVRIQEPQSTVSKEIKKFLEIGLLRPKR